MKQHFKGFNVRVYAVCIVNQKLLTLTAPFAGKLVTKLPGGGLEYGEGTVDCLKREFKEELNIDITVGDVFYVQADFITSLGIDTRQRSTLSLSADTLNLNDFKLFEIEIQKINWVSLKADNPITLPGDPTVFNTLRSKIL